MRLQLLACTLGMHHRDPDSSHAEGGRYVGACSGCGRPMVWTLSGWKLDRKGSTAPLPRPGGMDGK